MSGKIGLEVKQIFRKIKKRSKNWFLHAKYVICFFSRQGKLHEQCQILPFMSQNMYGKEKTRKPTNLLDS